MTSCTSYLRHYSS